MNCRFCLFLAAMLGALSGCATKSHQSLEPPLRADLHGELAPPFDALRDDLAAYTARHADRRGTAFVDACPSAMDAIESDLRTRLLAVDRVGDVEAARALRAALRNHVEREPAPLADGAHGFVWTPAVRRLCAESARIAGDHAGALQHLDELARTVELDDDDRRRRAWSQAALGNTRDALFEMAEIESRRWSEADRERIAIWSAALEASTDD